ncbi:anion permease [Escherichia coli]|uniref:anion permease n=1 Tax=Escherichia coli TaxID=562 RepID=UPI003974DEB2
MNKKSLWKLILILAIPCIIGFMPAPAGLSELAWVLFGIYLAAIVGLVIKGRCEQVPDMRSSYSSGAHPRGTS